MSMSHHNTNGIRVAEQEFSPRDLVRLVVRNWYWFLTSVIISISACWLYISTTRPVYERCATVMVRDSRKGSAAELTAFSDIMPGVGNSSVDNELHIFLSRRVMEEVVRSRNMQTRQTQQRGLRNVELYGREPIDVIFLDDDSEYKFEYCILNDSTLYIKDFEHLTPIGDTTTLPFGRVAFLATPHLEKFVGSEIQVRHNSLNASVEEYRSRLKCEIKNKQASIITLTIEDESSARAEDIINGIIDIYNDHAIEDKRTISQLTNEFITQRLSLISQELNIADSDIAEFKSRSQLFSPESHATLASEELQKLKHEELMLRTNLEMANYILDHTTSSTELSLIPASAASLTGLSATLATQIESYNRALLEYKRLGSESTESNPKIAELQTEIIALRDIIIGALKTNIETLKLQIDNTMHELSGVNQRLSKTPADEKTLVEKSRQQKVKEELYIYLLTKLEENSLMGATAESNARVIDSAYGPDKPIKPHTAMLYTLAVMMGCLIPFLILYLRERLNTTVRSRRDIERVVTAPFLGEIPLIKSGAKVREDGRDTLSEAFRMLRTNLGFMSVSHPIKVLMITSSVPHSGKTFVATNLATMLTTASKRVLLIDVDLRRRTLTKNLGYRNDRRGLSSLLSGIFSSPRDIIVHSDEHPGIDIICAGPLPPNPAEMLMSERLDTLIATLSQEYDHIILDSVPAMAVADALIIDRLADLAIYVIHEGRLDRSQLADIEALHTSHKLHNMCILLNGATPHATSYGYGYATDEESRWQRFRRRFN